MAPNLKDLTTSLQATHPYKSNSPNLPNSIPTFLQQFPTPPLSISRFSSNLASYGPKASSFIDSTKETSQMHGWHLADCRAYATMVVLYLTRDSVVGDTPTGQDSYAVLNEANEAAMEDWAESYFDEHFNDEQRGRGRALSEMFSNLKSQRPTVKDGHLKVQVTSRAKWSPVRSPHSLPTFPEP
ncbi:hypothetical protein M231_03006 [Tremella mesenterica]|uniref:Uncharacterized protein n=1 Tax=Tremella mesenterica TaxID=5217 RepID=A0A4Q1BPF2_TREME|nr:uncharacterized protein TREMEDRAFT_65332 [Tremella mesenterica DSM 1558]EIW66470.1 hypothetical protein TREMEDRAFT_65332 [Tremella mesenterica DSM 1558]RXK39652.1 hypothetical protein M231_03006 [Tremella mesenterica]